MKKIFLSGLLLLAILTTANTAFASRHEFDHIGQFNFMLELGG